MRFIFVAALGCLLVSCAGRENLTEQQARATAEIVVESARPELRDFDHMEWQALRQVSPTEAHGIAVLVYWFQLPDSTRQEERVPGKFVYHRADEGWVLDYMDFPNPDNPERAISRQTFEKVPSRRRGSGTPPETATPTAGRSRETGDETPPPRPPRDSADAFQPPGVDVPLSRASARETAERYVATAHPDSATWRVKEFGALAPVGRGDYTLPATLVVEHAAGATREYRGAFVFTYEPPKREWRLTRIAFHAEGQEPIEKEVRPPVVVG